MRPLHALLQEQTLGTLATLKRDGGAQLSNVSYTYDPATSMIRVSTSSTGPSPRTSAGTHASACSRRRATGGRTQWPRAPRSLSAVAAEPDDDTVEELIDVYRAIARRAPGLG